MKKLLIVFLCIISVLYTYENDMLPIWTTTALDRSAKAAYEVLDQVRMKKSGLQAELHNIVSAENGQKYVPCQYYKTYAIPREKEVVMQESQHSTGMYYVSGVAPSGLVLDYTHVSAAGSGLCLRYNGAGAGTSGYALYRSTNRGQVWNDCGNITFTGQIEELSAVEGTVVLNTCSYLEGYPHTMLLITANNGKGWSSYELAYMFPELKDIEGVCVKVLDLQPEEMTLGLFVREGVEQEDEPYYFYTAEVLIAEDMLEITEVFRDDREYLQMVRARQAGL